MIEPPLKHLDIFSGIAGFAYGLKMAGGFETVCFCEKDPYCQKVIAKNFPGVPIYDDVRTLEYDGPIDIITGGYPCQPFSVAGKRQGKEDDRHLWPAMFDLIKKHRPTWVIGENVAGHISMGLDDVLADLESENYTVRTFIIPAVAVDAKHRRDRLWIVANRQGDGRVKGKQNSRGCGAGTIVGEEQGFGNDSGTRAHTTGLGFQDGGGPQNRRPKKKPKSERCSSEVRGSQAFTNTNSQHVQGKQSGGPDPQERTGPNKRQIGSQGAGNGRFWPTEPGVGRVANGIPRRVDRLKGLGNAVVPQIPEIIGRAIINSIRKTA